MPARRPFDLLRPLASVRRPLPAWGSMAVTLALAVFPHGGQARSRRNAWGALAEAAAAARADRLAGAVWPEPPELRDAGLG